MAAPTPQSHFRCLVPGFGTGVERRRGWFDDGKLSILQEAAKPDARIADVARRHDIKPQQIFTWRRKFATAQAEPVVSFLPVVLIAAEASDEAERPAPVDNSAVRWSALPMRIEIGCKGGRALKVETNIAPDVLKALIRSVEDA
ncbi:hypothetical protein ACO34A_01955 [Rhizobium sp. ACO-34A]|nr:transposase [Rhizobium sp. ACO-34A]ATN32570.1 hypothetical protein ACO34A_01955 [Rhizobium sp. ACO-34A]